jgi:hypothetical protein
MHQIIFRYNLVDLRSGYSKSVSHLAELPLSTEIQEHIA